MRVNDRIRGIIGNVRVQNAGDTKVANTTVANDYGYTTKDGSSVNENT